MPGWRPARPRASSATTRKAAGRKTLLLVADDNFSETQVTQVIGLALELNPETQGADWNALAAQATADFAATGHWFV